MIRKHLKIFAYLSICLLFFSTSLLASANSILNKTSNTDSSERLLFCTPQGLKWISLASLTTDTGSTEIPPTNISHDCPFSASDEYFIDDALINSSLSFSFNPSAKKACRSDLIDFTLSDLYLSSIRAIRAPPIFS